MVLRLKLSFGFMSLIAVYAPTDVCKFDVKEMFYAKLTSVEVALEPKKETQVVAGETTVVEELEKETKEVAEEPEKETQEVTEEPEKETQQVTIDPEKETQEVAEDPEKETVDVAEEDEKENQELQTRQAG
ncbi:glutamic acid-rich protein-like [Penaeus vannamei]|uniref:glutamic acid-rich protein-like n=1 Tax=Penaeus vannamei TaxID=6689 RepID=UPI00387F91D9